ncbi:hypothetical protein FGG08_000878 [Glutinoglossum americanum]|uniref:Microbial-type PARG catalytic domain-containing protein n=1 Tax=Glutinoglossum americanum TaxID=1670608 RepID=A0A9P8I990_9PEZI|nr:hypothetical protein FGG08_000878 [Glutinoglossum americanum]
MSDYERRIRKALSRDAKDHIWRIGADIPESLIATSYPNPPSIPAGEERPPPKIEVVGEDPMDVALGCIPAIPVVNMAHKGRPGGDWETGSMVFRNWDSWDLWGSYKTLSVISVAPERNPYLDISKTRYSFDLERTRMRANIRTILRIAAVHGHKELCAGTFGVGPGYHHPAAEIATMWAEVLSEDEFRSAFTKVIFAIKGCATDVGGKGILEAFQEKFSNQA